VTPRYLSLDNNGSATDEAGRFRIFGLEPGQYLINALPSVGGATARTALADQYVDAMLNDLRSGGRVGQPRAPAAAVEAPTVVYSPVYYPGTARIEDAAPVTLGPGDTVEGLDIRFVHVPAVTVSGTVQFADGSPAGGVDVRMAAADRPRGTTNPLMADRRYSATTNSAGAFVIPHVPPGRYEIAATVRGSQESLTQPGSKEPSTLWAIDHVTVDGTQVSGLRLRVVPALTIRGRVQLQGRAGPLPATFAEARIAMILSTAPLPPTLRGSALGRLGPDGTFVIPDLRPDSEYRLVLDGVPEPWWPESALMAGTELLEGPVYMTGGLASNALTVILSSSPASLSGTLAGGTSVGDVFIVIFPAERERWSSERRTRGVQPDARGQYRVSGLPPGDYLVGVVGDADPDDWKNPTFLERVAQAAIPVTLGRGETRRLDLNLR
jgi:hypothetical protein